MFYVVTLVVKDQVFCDLSIDDTFTQWMLLRIYGQDLLQ